MKSNKKKINRSKGKLINKKGSSLLLAIVSGVLLCVFVTAAFSYVFNVDQLERTVHVKEKNDINYEVHYKDNSFFPNSMNKKDQSYLLGYTKYIELDNKYSAEFDKKISVAYDYEVMERLIIRQRKNASISNTDAPIVLEQEYPLDSKKGTLITQKIDFSKNPDGSYPGGTYKIDLTPFQNTYDQFIEDEADRNPGVNIDQTLNFAAEIQLDFTYKLKSEEHQMDKTITRGVTIPITEKAYAIGFTGEDKAEYDVPDRVLNIPKVIPTIGLLILFSLATFGLVTGIKNFAKTGDPFLDTIKKILRKYSDDIIVTTASEVQYSNAKRISVGDFRELLKISINQGKPITFCGDAKRGWAIFFVLYDGLRYEYLLVHKKAGETWNKKKMKMENRTAYTPSTAYYN